MAANENPLAGSTAERAKVNTHTNIRLNAEQIKAIFGDLVESRLWVPRTEAKIPSNGARQLSTNEPADWCTLPDALNTAEEWRDLSGVGIALTGGIRLNGKRLIGIDIDKVTGPIDLLDQLDTYTEISPSGKGRRAFCWVPEAFAQQYRDTVSIKLPNCDHAEFYLGSAARYLTVTFNLDGEAKPIAVLDNARQGLLAALLKPAEPVREQVGAPISEGTPAKLEQYKLTPDQRALVDGRTEGMDRSNVLHGLLIKLIDEHARLEDLLATIFQTPALWQICLNHRRDDPTRAAEFAQQEVARAYSHSMTGKRDKLVGFNKQWKTSNDPQNALDATPRRGEAGLQLVSAAELVKKAGPVNWLIHGYVESDTLALVFGPPASYKSFIALGVAVAVASGQPWHGHAVTRQGWVVYVCGEGHNGIARRLQAVCQRRCIDPKTLPLVFTNMAVGLTDAVKVTRLKDAIAALDQPPVLIVIDTLARNFGADENSTTDMNAFIANIDALRGTATVLIVHHTGHTNQERERGSSALRGAIDASYKVEYTPHLHAVRIEPCKMKDAELPPLLFLMPKVVELDNVQDDTGGSVTSVVLEAGAEQQLARITNFYEQYPSLKKGKRQQYLPKLLEHIFDKPEISQHTLADELGVSIGSVNTWMKELRNYKLIEDDSQRLTSAGENAAAILVGGRIAVQALQTTTYCP